MANLDGAAILDQLRNLDFYSECHVKESVTTTFDWLKELVELGAPHATIVIAERQTAGKGRRGRTWESPVGGAWFGILLRPDFDVEQSSCMSIVCSVALAKGIENRYNLPVKIKWPNDLLLYDKKLCGILSELVTEGSNVRALNLGMGVNVNNVVPKEARLGAISISEILGHDVDLADFYGIVLRSFAETYRQFISGGLQSMMSDFESYSAITKKLWIDRDDEMIEAEYCGLSELGRLIVKYDGKTEELIADDVTLSLSR